MELSHFRRRAVPLLVAALVVVSLLASAPAAAAGGSGGTPTAAFANDSGIITVLMADGSTKSLGVAGEYAGPMRNLDGDEYLEVPFVDGDGDVRVVDTTGATATLVEGDAGMNTIAVGDWNGDGTSAVIYENDSAANDYLYRVEDGGAPEPVLGPDGNEIKTNGPVGIADFDGDGGDDLVFLGSSSTVKYYDGSTIQTTGFSSFGSNNGLGIGAPADVDGDGVARVPYVTGGNNLGLLAHDGSTTKLNQSYGEAAKGPVAATDVAGDSTPEILHVNTDDDTLYYSYLNGSVGPVLDDEGGEIGAVRGFGAYGAAAPPAPQISDFDATTPSGREIRISFDASEQLTDVTVDVTGPDDRTLTESDLSESGSGPYSYAGTTTVDADGNYTATLTRATNGEGIDGAENQTDGVTIQTPSPAVGNVTIADGADGNGIVGGNDTLRVTAAVDNRTTLTSVAANASAFGAGTVALTSTGGRYAGTFRVDASAADPDGARAVAVTATNEYGHSDANESGTLVLDTTAPVPDAGQNRTVEEDTSVGFDADGSTDETGITRYRWAFGDGANATGPTAVHTYDDPGTYTATLTVYDVENHSATDERTVRVDDVSDATETTTEVVTETEVVYVDDGSTDGSGDASGSGDGGGDAAADGGDDADGATDDPRPPMRVILSTDDGAVVDGDVVYAREGRTVSIPFDRLNATRDRPTSLRAVEFDIHRRGNFTVRRVPRDGPPGGRPALDDGRPVRPLRYVSVNHSVDEGNVSDVSLTATVSKAALEGAPPSAIRVYRFDGGWHAHDATIVGESADTYRIRAAVPGLSTFAVGVVRPDLTVASASLGGSATDGTLSVAVDEPTRVTARVENQGARAGTSTVTLRVDGDVVARRTVSVPAGESQRIVFREAFEETGSHVVAVGDARAGTVRVGGDPDPTPYVFLPFLLLIGFSGYAYLSSTGRLSPGLGSLAR